MLLKDLLKYPTYADCPYEKDCHADDDLNLPEHWSDVYEYDSEWEA